MSWQLPEDVTVDSGLSEFVGKYRAHYLRFFLDYFRANHRPGYRGGYFNINSVSGRPYDHTRCYSWTDGRSLGELSASYLYELGDKEALRDYADHLHEILLERYELNGYFPHAVEDDTNLAAADPMNVKLEPGWSSFSHVFVLNGLLQYALVFRSDEAWELGWQLVDELENALEEDLFLEGAQPRPAGQRAQGPFMITLGAIADLLETMETRWGRGSAEDAAKPGPLVDLGRSCVEYILGNNYRPEDNAFWELSEGGEGVQDDAGRVVTDPGHTIEFTGFAVRFAAFLEPEEREQLLATSRAIFLWAAANGFHPTRDLSYKNIDRDTKEPLRDQKIADISKVVSAAVVAEHFDGEQRAAEVATFPWWVPMELIAAGSVLRHGDASGQVDDFILRAVKGIFEYYPNDRIEGLCYQNIGDEFFDWVDVPPATPTLDLMHSHRSMRVFLREIGC